MIYYLNLYILHISKCLNKSNLPKEHIGDVIKKAPYASLGTEVIFPWSKLDVNHVTKIKK